MSASLSAAAHTLQTFYLQHHGWLVARLRRKIETDPHNPKMIRTVYGAGYLFASEVSWN